MAKSTEGKSISFRCPPELVKSIETQAKQTGFSQSDIIITMLKGEFATIHITERFKLPTKPGFYFVYTPSHKALHLNASDNLRRSWDNHHGYQYFIEESMECRIGYFACDSLEELQAVIKDFNINLTPAPPAEYLFNIGELYEQVQNLTQEVERLRERDALLINLLAQAGIDTITEKLEAQSDAPPPRGLQKWDPGKHSEAIVPSDLLRKFSFKNTAHLERVAKELDLDPMKYLEELSGWKFEKIGKKAKFYPPSPESATSTGSTQPLPSAP